MLEVVEKVKIEDFASCPKTELLYWEDSYLPSFTSEVLRFEPDKKNRAYVVLDRTAFHPKSGGQPSDKGRITGMSVDFEVKKAMLVKGVIVHWGKMTSGERLDGRVEGLVDWDLRHLLMRRHTAGHLLDHCIELVTENRVQTTGSWLGEPSWVGYSGSPPSQEQLEEIERIANSQIRKGRPVITEKVSKQELMRRTPNAPNIDRLPDEKELRLVTIDGQIPIPCGGTHLKDISEVGVVRITEVEPVDEGYKVYYEVG